MIRNQTLKSGIFKAFEISLLIVIALWLIPSSIMAQGGFIGYPYNNNWTLPYNYGVFGQYPYFGYYPVTQPVFDPTFTYPQTFMYEGPMEFPIRYEHYENFSVIEHGVYIDPGLKGKYFTIGFPVAPMIPSDYQYNTWLMRSRYDSPPSYSFIGNSHYISPPSYIGLGNWLYELRRVYYSPEDGGITFYNTQNPANSYYLSSSGTPIRTGHPYYNFQNPWIGYPQFQNPYGMPGGNLPYFYR
ncbi:MAG: hypothetical protein ACMUIM_00915 [bacterium]